MITKLITKIKKFFNRKAYVYRVDAMDGKKYIQLRISTVEFLGKFKVSIRMRSDYMSFDCNDADFQDMGKVCEAMKPFMKESGFQEYLDEKIKPHWGNWYYM